MIGAFARLGRGLAGDRRGTSLLEFALGLPVMLAAGGYGIEVANLSLTHMRISQIALTLADNASRIGVNSGLATYQVREADINDVLQGARLLGARLNLTGQGRVTISSLENIKQSYDNAPVQRIHWQRCMGVKSGYGTASAALWDSSYGSATPLATAGTDGTKPEYAGTTSSGMGPAPMVTAPSGSALIFVEINYQYTPLFGTMFLPAANTRIHYIASFIMRDNRDFSQLWNPVSALGTAVPRATCDLHNA